MLVRDFSYKSTIIHILNFVILIKKQLNLQYLIDLEIIYMLKIYKFIIYYKYIIKYNSYNGII